MVMNAVISPSWFRTMSPSHWRVLDNERGALKSYTVVDNMISGVDDRTTHGIVILPSSCSRDVGPVGRSC